MDTARKRPTGSPRNSGTATEIATASHCRQRPAGRRPRWAMEGSKDALDSVE